MRISPYREFTAIPARYRAAFEELSKNISMRARARALFLGVRSLWNSRYFAEFSHGALDGREMPKCVTRSYSAARLRNLSERRHASAVASTRARIEYNRDRCIDDSGISSRVILHRSSDDRESVGKQGEAGSSFLGRNVRSSRGTPLFLRKSLPPPSRS